MMRPRVWIPGFDSQFATIAGVRLHYWIGGDPSGQPVILWHGFLSAGFAWRDVAPALAQAGLSVPIPDMRGYGDSDKPAGKDAYDARGGMPRTGRRDRLRARQTLIYAAHDMGALPALMWSEDHSEEIAGLVYIEAPAGGAQSARYP